MTPAPAFAGATLGGLLATAQSSFVTTTVPGMAFALKDCASVRMDTAETTAVSFRALMVAPGTVHVTTGRVLVITSMLDQIALRTLDTSRNALVIVQGAEHA